MERMGGKLCPLDGRVITMSMCCGIVGFSSQMLDTVCKAFGLVSTESRQVGHSSTGSLFCR